MLDEVHLWAMPVKVRIAADGSETAIDHAARARHALLIEWPAAHTALHKAACDACLAAMQGNSADTARMAFIEAAIEADVFIE